MLSYQLQKWHNPPTTRGVDQRGQTWEIVFNRTVAHAGFLLFLLFDCCFVVVVVIMVVLAFVVVVVAS